MKAGWRTIGWVVLVWVWLVVGSPPAVASGALADRWHVIETPNFRVWYHEPVAPMAQEVAALCERAHELLAPLFPIGVGPRTDVLLTDDLDVANGSARVVPSRLIRLYGMAPEAESVLGDHDHWMWALIVHEYVHILHLDSTSGLPSLVNLPGRKVAAPNALLPRWLVEGLATWQESVQSGGGRMRSSLFEMQMRMALLDREVPTLGALSGIPARWPQATGWYLFGSRFVGWLAEQHGQESITTFVRLYGRRVLPYGINIVALEAFGADLPTLWNRWLREARAEAEAWAALRSEAGLTLGEPVTRGGGRSRRVVTDPTGRVVAWLEDDTVNPTRIVVQVEDAHWQVDLRASGDFALLPGGRALVVSQPGISARQERFRDLWLVERETGAWTQLTAELRAREPAVDSAGRFVAFVRPDLGATHLHLLDLEDGSHRRLLDAGPWGQLAQPVFLADGRIVASWMRVDEGRDLVVVDPHTGDWELLTDGRHFAMDPAVVAESSWVVYTADPEGVFEVHALDLATGEQRVLTRSLGGAFSPAVHRDPSGEAWLWFATYGGQGWDIRKERLRQLMETASPPPPGYERPLVQRTPTRPLQPQSRPHRSLGDWRVLSWTPTLRTGGVPGLGAGLVWSGTDPPERITAQGDLAWESDVGTLTGAAEFLFRTQVPHLGVSVSRLLLYRQQGRFTEGEQVPWWESFQTLSLSTSFPFSHPTSSQSLSVGYTYSRSAVHDAPAWEPRPEDPAPSFPTFGRQGALRLSWNWSNTRGQTRSISTESGSALQAGFRWRSEVFGGTSEGADASALARHFVPMPWWRGHVLALRLQGGVGVTGSGQRQLFSVGGPRPQDVLDALIEFAPTGLQPVRGYSPGLRRGDRFYTAVAEYRFPLFDLDAGIATLPLTLSRLHAAMFVDAGDAWQGNPALATSLVGAGAELRLSTWIGYVQPAAFRLGIARGLTAEGELSAYLFYGGGF